MSKFGGLSLEVEKPRRMVILHPKTRRPISDKSKRKAYIDLYSTDSRVATEHVRAVQQSRLDAQDGGRPTTPEQIETAKVDYLVALTADWYLLALDGEPLGVEFTSENVRELYADRGMAWLRDEVDIFVATRANFLPASSINSSSGQNGSSGEPDVETTGPRKAPTPTRATAS